MCDEHTAPAKLRFLATLEVEVVAFDNDRERRPAVRESMMQGREGTARDQRENRNCAFAISGLSFLPSTVPPIQSPHISFPNNFTYENSAKRRYQIHSKRYASPETFRCRIEVIKSCILQSCLPAMVYCCAEEPTKGQVAPLEAALPAKGQVGAESCSAGPKNS